MHRTHTYIADRQLTCRNHNQILFRGRIISTSNRNRTDLLENLEIWLSQEPTVTTSGGELKVVIDVIGGTVGARSRSSSFTGSCCHRNGSGMPQAKVR